MGPLWRWQGAGPSVSALAHASPQSKEIPEPSGPEGNPATAPFRFLLGLWAQTQLLLLAIARAGLAITSAHFILQSRAHPAPSPSAMPGALIKGHAPASPSKEGGSSWGYIVSLRLRFIEWHPPLPQWAWVTYLLLQILSRALKGCPKFTLEFWGWKAEGSAVFVGISCTYFLLPTHPLAVTSFGAFLTLTTASEKCYFISPHSSSSDLTSLSPPPPPPSLSLTHTHFP